MTLVFVGHSFKYELEAVTKLFFPVETFDFVTADFSQNFVQITGDRCILTREIFSGTAQLTAECTIKSRQKIMSEKVRSDEKNYEKACEFTLCKLLFLCLREQTGISPKWGMLTGVRPVKLITRLKNDGMTNREIIEKLEKTLYVSEEKINLGLQTAQNQQKVLADLPKNKVSLYVSIPFCPSRSAYCSFVSQTVGSFLSLIPDYVDRLCEEIKFTADLLKGRGLGLDTVYFGGGTPTSLTANQLDKIMKTVSANFDISSLREYTVEAGRPDTVTEEKLSAIINNGGDRISVNPQTIHDYVLEAIGRKHTTKQFFEAYDLARKFNFSAVNIDLISGLPKDTPAGFIETVNQIIKLNPENITIHALSIKRAADLMQNQNREIFAEDSANMISEANKLLETAGYRPYYLYRQKNQLDNLENVGWERGGHAGIYNINMMEEVQTVISVGAGGSTKIVNGDTKIQRFYNPKYPLDYLRSFDETVLKRKIEAVNKIEI